MLKQINILGLRCRKLRTFPGKFLNFGKSAGVKDLTNIMSGSIVLMLLWRYMSFRNGKYAHN